MLPQNTTTEPVTVHRLTSHTSDSFDTVIQRFRSLVPQVNLRDIVSSTNAKDIEDVIKATGTTTDFVLFYEMNHGRWIRHFPALPQEFALTSDTPTAPDSTDSTTHSVDDAVHRGRGLIRFVFGNPLIAITMIREDAEAGLHVPVECCFVEQEDGSTKMIMMLPGGLIAGHGSGHENGKLKEAVGALEEKVLRLIGEVIK